MKRIAILPLLLSASLNAQEKDSTLLPVEVRAVRAGAAAPFAKTNIDKAAIERQNLGQDLPFLLNQTPSVVVNADAGNGIGYTGIRIRGTDATRINITLNGIPYNDAESGGTFFVNLPDFASSVNSIQVQRGVGTSTNGAGAFGATINLSTHEVNRKAYAEFNNSVGSFNTWKNTLKAGTGLLGGHFVTDLRLSRISSDGFIDRASSKLRSLFLSSAYLSDKTDIRFNLISGREKTYQAWYGVSEADLKTNRRINYAGTERPGAPYENETDNYSQDHYQLFFTQRFSSRLSLHTGLFYTGGKGYYEQYKADQAYARYGLPDAVSGSDTIRRTDLVRQLWLKNHFYGTIYSLQYASAKTQLIAGGSLTRYDGRHFGRVTWAEKGLTGFARWYDQPALKTDLTLYAKWEQLLLPGFRLFADLQYRKVRYDLNGFRQNPAINVFYRDGFFNPKAGLSYQSGSWFTYLSYSIAHKEPNRDDFETGLQSQPRAERLQDLEAGIEHRTPKHFLSANLYYMRYRDQLALTGQINDVGAYTRTNIPNSYRLGVELQGSYLASSWLKAGANLTISRNRILDFVEYLDDYDNGGQKQVRYPQSELALSPALVGAATVTLTPLRALAFDLVGKYVSRQYLDNTGNPLRSLRPFYTQDLRVLYSFSWRRLRQATLIGQVNNLLNKQYEPNGYTFSYISGGQQVTENYYFPMAGINFMIGLNLRLE
jgi:iron complex outermembrane receptor protein